MEIKTAEEIHSDYGAAAWPTRHDIDRLLQLNILKRLVNIEKLLEKLWLGKS